VRQLHKLTALLMTVLLLSQAILPASAAETPPGQVPLYLQQDYPNDRYGDGSIETNGCSVVCLAMVATYLTGHTYLPDELARYFGGRAENNIARLELASDALRLGNNANTQIFLHFYRLRPCLKLWCRYL